MKKGRKHPQTDWLCLADAFLDALHLKFGHEIADHGPIILNVWDHYSSRESLVVCVWLAFSCTCTHYGSLPAIFEECPRWSQPFLEVRWTL